MFNSGFAVEPLGYASMDIRTVNPKDIASWAIMRNKLWPDSEENHMKELKDFFSGDGTYIDETFVIEEKGELVGFIEINIRNYAEGSMLSRVPYVEGWYIEPSHQNRGYGKALMEAAECWAKKKGFSELASDAEVENKISIQAHKNLGFKEVDRIVCFLKKI